ncbi:MAG: hypothetical protein ACJAT4_001257 [Granulosicoccus sp.]|jgi:hypothetical protein
MMSPNLFVPLENYCQNFESEFHFISENRKKQLEELAQYISQKQKNNQPTRLNVICTHNSRRSHIGQLWLAAAALFYKKNNIHTFSGGTEATAFNHRSVAALRRAGFEIVTADSTVENPIYFSTFGFSQPPLKMFSKKYDHAENPQKEFAAIMVCSDADEGCPVILGAENRFALTFDDPKHFDDTDLESEKYDERVRQIGREMFYVMSKV